MLTATYRGYKIEVEREEAMGGWENLYYRIIRVSNGHFVVDNFTTGEDTEEEYIGYMKEWIDEELALPRNKRWTG